MSKKAKTTVATDPNPTLAADILTEFSALADEDRSDRAALLAKPRAPRAQMDIMTSDTTPVFLAVDVATGQTLGVSLHSFAAAILDANRGAARETPINWAFDGKEGQEYAGVVLQMGAL